MNYVRNLVGRYHGKLRKNRGPAMKMNGGLEIVLWHRSGVMLRRSECSTIFKMI